jgi:hypothetical protein
MPAAVVRDDPQSQHANAWLSWLYQFVAEDAADVEIPTEPKEPDGDLDIFENQAFVEEYIPLPAIADPLIDLPMSHGNGGKDLPSRYLPPGRIAELYDFYTTSSEHGHASKSTFARCFRAYWRHAIMFRDRSHHSRCSLCSKYSRQRVLCMSAEDKEEVKAAHAAHVRSVLNDRATYMRAQRLCEESCKPADQPEQVSKEESVLTISIDGMDQAKFRIPRNLDATKEFSTCWRPQQHMACCLVPGLLECQFLLGPDLPKDSCMEMTLLAHTLDLALERLQKVGRKLPAHLHVQADNTCREMRNQHLAKWGSLLVAKGSHSPETYTHTHSPISQLGATSLNKEAAGQGDSP